MTRVKIGKVPGTISEVLLEDGTSVDSAVEAAGLSTEGFSIRVNGETVDGDHTLSNGDEVILVKEIKGAV